MVTELKCNYNNLSSLSSFPRIGFSCELTVYQTITFPVVCALFGNHLGWEAPSLKMGSVCFTYCYYFCFFNFNFNFYFWGRLPVLC